MNFPVVKTADDLDTLRHDSAHLLAQAGAELTTQNRYPSSQSGNQTGQAEN